MGVKLIISFPSKEQASFGSEFNPGLVVTWHSFVRSGAQARVVARWEKFSASDFWYSCLKSRLASHFISSKNKVFLKNRIKMVAGGNLDSVEMGMHFSLL